MKHILFDSHRMPWRHGTWDKIQLQYFGPNRKIRREKNLEDYIINNGVSRLHLIKENLILDKFIEQQQIKLVEPELADLVVIIDQRFSRLDHQVLIDKLNSLLAVCPRIYFALNRYYLNANETFQDASLPDNFDHAIVQWLEHKLNAIVLNRSENFIEDGSWFTWVIPSCELLICRK